MRGPVWAVPLAIACGCGLTAPAVRVVAAPAPTAPAAPAATPPPVTAIWDVDSAVPASAVVHLHFVAAACSVVKRIVVAESADRVVITLDQAGRNGKDCTEPFLRHRDVRLAAPLGHRALYDGGVAPPALVRPGRS